MKKLVLKLLRMAKMEGDSEAKEALAYIEKNDLKKQTMVYFNSCLENTWFNWGNIRVAYNGRTDEITVFYKESQWTLCE